MEEETINILVNPALCVETLQLVARLVLLLLVELEDYVEEKQQHIAKKTDLSWDSYNYCDYKRFSTIENVQFILLFGCSTIHQNKSGVGF